MNIRLTVLVLSLFFPLIGCVVQEEIIPGGGTKPTKGIEEGASKRTLLVYMIASNLGDDLKNNLELISSVTTKENLNGGHLLVYYSENKEKASLFEIKPDEDGIPAQSVIRNYEGQSAVSKETMRNVINEVVTLYPADSYGMLLSSHASAWMPAGYHTMLRAFGEENGRWLEIDDLAEAIPDNLFDFLLFDACSMGAIECVYELKDKANYIVASPSEVLTVGFPYQTILPRLFTKEADLANVAKDFYEFFKTYTYPVGNISVTATKELDGLAAITKEILRGNEEAVLSLDISDIQVLSYLPKSPVVLVDFADMIKRLATEEQYRRFEKALEKAVLYPYSTKQIFTTGSGGYYDVATFSGLSVYPLRSNYTELNNWYRNRLRWYQAVF
ncbi:MAG: hypothetical protein LBU37_01850 [Tannerellaceae bacterium]|jgi:hypothetical protein|nr:hypothetical protein [Tannerellaceae bacterium]